MSLDVTVGVLASRRDGGGGSVPVQADDCRVVVHPRGVGPQRPQYFGHPLVGVRPAVASSNPARRCSSNSGPGAPASSTPSNPAQPVRGPQLDVLGAVGRCLEHPRRQPTVAIRRGDLAPSSSPRSQRLSAGGPLRRSADAVCALRTPPVTAGMSCAAPAAIHRSDRRRWSGPRRTDESRRSGVAAVVRWVNASRCVSADLGSVRPVAVSTPTVAKESREHRPDLRRPPHCAGGA